MRNLTPRQIVVELDRHIVGQSAAKRAVAIALRNRWRWLRLPADFRREVTPKNIIMIGPTGVGKTEITRRLADLTGAPFVKVEATRFTEVGYVGRDVESMVRELVEASLTLVRRWKRVEVEEQAEQRAEDRLLDLLVPLDSPSPSEPPNEELEQRHARTKEKFRQLLKSGALDERMVEIRVSQRKPQVQIFSNMGVEQMDMDLQNMFERLLPRQQKEREVAVKDARKLLIEQETEALLDQDAIQEAALRLAEESGIIFLDEIDKICAAADGGKSADVSRQGVQRDLLPIVEGTTVQTRYGPVKTDQVLFIAAGAFHGSRPSDLMPELQGRFPIRVELTDLTKDDFLRILTEPTGSLTRQYQELLKVDGIELTFTPDGLETLADLAWRVNQSTQNIGARRLSTMMERLLETVSFDGPDAESKQVTIDAGYVNSHLEEISQDEDLSRFIL